MPTSTPLVRQRGYLVRYATEDDATAVRIEDCVALAYVTGRYTPPGPKLGPAGFLGIYVAKTDPRLSFSTFDREGR